MSAFDAEWQARFERFARTHADDARVSGWSEAGLERRLECFRALLGAMRLAAGTACLDVGCGAGTYVRLLAALGQRPLGLDYSLPSLHRALAADPGRSGRYAAATAYALPFGSERFGLVVSIGVLQALAEPERALDEMVRVLEPGGWLVVEALNAGAFVTRARRAADACRRRPERVRSYEAERVVGWLRRRGLAPFRREALLLPPRTLPGLARLLGPAVLSRAVLARPRVAEALAHTFLFVARKPARAERGAA